MPWSLSLISRRNLDIMKQTKDGQNMTSWIFGLVILTIGLLNFSLVHAVPGIIGIILSLIFFPPINNFLKKKFNFIIPFALKVVIFILIMWFTLGVSDLGEIMGL